MRLIRKLCGMRRADDIRNAEQLDIDWIGFIFWQGSPRYVGDCLTYLPQQKRSIGVFVNADVEEIASAVSAYRLGGVQLHGDESIDYCRRLRKLFPADVVIIKAIGVKSESDARKGEAYDGIVDYLLFDTKCSGYGGSGTGFNWDVLATYQGSTPFLLSGGIGIDSAEALHRFSHPRFAGIDINSRFEVEPAVKDIRLVADFLNTITDL
ncbi:MAG: phosphoribosylanthranilate isomerase [Muribaculaceae bacterium]